MNLRRDWIPALISISFSLGVLRSPLSWIAAGGFVVGAVVLSAFWSRWSLAQERPRMAAILAWSVLSAPLWVAGGLVDAEASRWVLWLAALGIDLVGPLAAYWLPGAGSTPMSQWQIEGAHFGERFQLFVIIALGESIVLAGATASDTGLSVEVVTALLLAFLSSTALWWLYFGQVAGAVLERIRGATAEERGQIGRDIYTYLHLPIVAGIVLVAVGDELVIAHPTDGSIWGAVPGPMPGRIVRIDPKTCVSEVYEPPFNNPAVNVNGYTPRGIDVDNNGVIWTALAGSGHLASFDRRKCHIMSGPEATNGQHCPEGWTLYRAPGPSFKGATDAIAVDMHYYNFVDRYNTLGLGPNVPLANGTNSDSLLALLPDGRFVRLRVPYPLGFYSRGMDGRIDDPNGGWKGRGLYADYGPNAVWHTEGGKGTRSSVVKFQLRPDPLAK